MPKSRQEAARVRDEPRKKLRGALRYILERKGTDDWISQLRAEEPDAAAVFDEPEQFPGVETQPWHEMYWRAWSAIRFDRQYGAFGGESRLSYMVIRQYAADHQITDESLQTFQAAMRGLDEEWLAFVASRTHTGSQTT